MSDSDSFHFRNASASTSSSTSTSGTSYSFILEHILSYPGSYEMPLRTMYTLNCASRSQATSPTASSPISVDLNEQTDLHTANTQMTNSLLAQISQLPSQPASLPPSFITMFVKRCFTPEIHWVDFPQALTALDYLRDLETRRRREATAVLSRLGLDGDRAAADTESIRLRYPGAASWVSDLEVREKRADALYTQLYIALRRWVLINEMSLLPFNKHNCIAMLNTLYPPVNRQNPTAKLTPAILSKQRDGFFRYIRAVETRGVAVLKTLQSQGAAAGEDNGWPEVHRNLDKYLRLANSMINECADVAGISAFATGPPNCPLPNIPQHSAQQQQHHHHRQQYQNPYETPKKTPRKTDSGVSFSSSSRPVSREAPAVMDGRRPSLPQSTAAAAVAERASTPATPRKAGSTLERIARELNRLRKRPDVEEIVKTPGMHGTLHPQQQQQQQQQQPQQPKTPRGLRKMKSLGALSELQQSNGSSSALLRFGKKAPLKQPDRDALRQERLAYESASGLSQSRLGYD